MFVDTHLHLIDRSRLSYPWLSGNAALNHDFSYAQYAKEALRAGIADVLHMEVDVDEKDMARETEFIRAQAQQKGNLIRGVTAACRPENADFPTYLEKCLTDPFVKGFRRVLHVMPDELSESTLFRENIRRLNGTGKHFDLVVQPHQIPRAAALIDLAPDTQFILDHCGVPDIKGRAEHPWRENIAEIAKRPNVTAKISGVVAYADPESWTAETLRPWVEHVIGSFGWDRVVWGSDWPVCTLGGGLLHWIAATFALTAGCSLDERERLFWRNADKIWNLGLAAKAKA
ncbi:MAG TPA: amidohydrolase [Rhizobiaceae bacterium]|nr:amidohydrolase [Rhizobiaceae bacterium]